MELTASASLKELSMLLLSRSKKAASAWSKNTSSFQVNPAGQKLLMLRITVVSKECSRLAINFRLTERNKHNRAHIYTKTVCYQMWYDQTTRKTQMQGKWRDKQVNRGDNEEHKQSKGKVFILQFIPLAEIHKNPAGFLITQPCSPPPGTKAGRKDYLLVVQLRIGRYFVA